MGLRYDVSSQSARSPWDACVVTAETSRRTTTGVVRELSHDMSPGAVAKQQKELDKQLRRAEAAAKRSARPEHCQKTLHALVDRRVLEVAGGGQLLAVLQETSEVTVRVTSAPLLFTIGAIWPSMGHNILNTCSVVTSNEYCKQT